MNAIVRRWFRANRPSRLIGWQSFAWGGSALLLGISVAVFLVSSTSAAPACIGFKLINGGNSICGESPQLFKGTAGNCLTQAAVKPVQYNWSATDNAYVLPAEEPGTDKFTITITSTTGNTSTATLADAEGNNCLVNPAGGNIGVPSRTITINDNGLKPKGGGTPPPGKQSFTFVNSNTIHAAHLTCAITNGIASGNADFGYDYDGSSFAYTWHPVGVHTTGISTILS
jgi:hypothetical protein